MGIAMYICGISGGADLQLAIKLLRSTEERSGSMFT